MLYIFFRYLLEDFVSATQTPEIAVLRRGVCVGGRICDPLVMGRFVLYPQIAHWPVLWSAFAVS